MNTGCLFVQQISNGRWMFTATMGDGIHAQVGVEADEVTAHRVGREALKVQRERAAAYERCVELGIGVETLSDDPR